MVHRNNCSLHRIVQLTGRISVFDVNGGYTKVSDDGYVTRGSNSEWKDK